MHVGCDRAARATSAGPAVLREHVRRVAATGRLRVTEERVVNLIHAMGTGTVLTLLEKAPHEREGLAEAAREAALASVIGETLQRVDAGPSGAATALQAQLKDVT